MALGLRGVPNVPGGIEVHASELYPRLQALGADVTVLARSPFRTVNAPTRWQGIAIRWLPCPRLQGVEALVHTFIGVVYAGVRRPDVLHIHAVGPWLMVPLAKLLGLNVVVTHHGEDYRREKWKPPARALLRLGERMGMLFANERIVISSSLLELARSKYARDATLIPNGVSEPKPMQPEQLLARYGLTPRRYVIQVSRLVPEKRQIDLIKAFNAAGLPGWKLILVGGAQGSQRYADLVRREIEGNEAIVNTGFLTSPEVQQLLSQAGVFVLPSSHEGLPISLLEAMKLGTPVIASDIVANREVGLDDKDYFGVGDTEALTVRLREVAAATPQMRAQIGQRLIEQCKYFDWDVVAESTMRVMERVARSALPRPIPGTRPARRPNH
jgi:glycosyltransferase involved in cell wall biosynthesis